LGRLVRSAAAPYRDETLVRRLRDAETRAQTAVTTAWAQATTPYQRELDRIERDLEPIVDRYQAALERLRDAMAAELAPLNERLDGVRHAIQTASRMLTPELPERPQPEVTEVDERGWLYRSERSYMEQLAAYKARRGGDDGDPEHLAA
jgi:hypothetical protein